MRLKKLTELNGISGNEKEVRDFILNEIKPLVDELYVDNIGNIIAHKHGKPGFPKVMVCAHMDEIGLMVKGIDEDGFLKFVEVGGIDTRILVSKPVVVGPKRIPGVIGSKPIHLQTQTEANKPLEQKQLYIDIGAKDRRDAEKLVKKGDMIVFDSHYVEFGTEMIKAKALDDRCGCAALIELLEDTYDVNLAAVFTVQEEIGTRGATIAAYHLNPDLGFVLEGTVCSDVSNVPAEWTMTHLGQGPAVSLLDGGTLYMRDLAKRLYDCGKALGLSIQYRTPGSGGNDSAAIHLSRQGIPCVALAVPCRYIHSPSSVMNRNDYEGYKKIAKEFLKGIQKGEFICE